MGFAGGWRGGKLLVKMMAGGRSDFFGQQGIYSSTYALGTGGFALR